MPLHPRQQNGRMAAGGKRHRGMTRRVEGKVALVTGAANGIGRSAALVLAREGAKIVATDLQDAKGEEFEKTGEDLLARAFLHETDHLNGRLYITHISALKRDLMKRKIKKLQRAGGWS